MDCENNLGAELRPQGATLSHSPNTGEGGRVCEARGTLSFHCSKGPGTPGQGFLRTWGRVRCGMRTHVLWWGGGTCCPHFQPSLCILKFRLPKWGLSPVSRNGFWGRCLLPHQTLSFSI